MIFQDVGDEPFKYSYTVTESNLVQVLKCDFTGDGIEDMVVEDLLSVGSGGYWYSFYEATADGGYKKVDGGGVQLVGLCAIPRKDSRGCGFIVIGKDSNPVLTANILSVKDGKLVWEAIFEKLWHWFPALGEPGQMVSPRVLAVEAGGGSGPRRGDA